MTTTPTTEGVSVTSAAIAAPVFDLDTVPEHHRDRVAALIPHPLIAEMYVHRMVDGVEDFAMLDYAIAKGENVLLAGPTGSSKTTLFRAYASARGLPFTVVECNAAMDVGVVLGRTTVGADGAIDFIEGDFTLVVMYGGVGLIDEINMAHPRVSAGFHQLLAVTRRMSLPEAGLTIKAGCSGTGDPQPLLLGAAYNPRYQGVVRLNEALSNRFALPTDWDYDRGVEEQLVTSTRLLDLAANIRSLAEIRTPVSTNSLMEFEAHVEALGMAFAIGRFVARFTSEERGPVNRALEAEAHAIAHDLHVAIAGEEF